MRQMKDSKIEWIGEIPKDWKLIRLKGLFVDRCGGAWGDEAKNDVNDIVCIRVADFDFEKQIVKDSDKTLRNYQPQVICKLKLEENDLLIEKSGGGEKTPVGRTILATGCSGYLFANFIDRLRIRDSHYSKFVAYLFRSLYFNGIIFLYVKQTTGIQNLDVENLLRENIFVPLNVKQQKIADFLDDKCKKIDSLIAHEESTIEELKAYKQSVITEAVTKGLDKSVPMKDSGVEWIGEIPESWSISKIKMLADETQENAFIDGDWIESPYIEDTGIRYLTTGNIGDGVFKRQGNGFISNETFTKLQCKYAFPQDLIFSRLNEEYGRSCILPNDYDKYVIAVDNVILRTKEEKRYICYVTQCSNYHKAVFFYARGTAMKRISRTNLGNVAISLPSIAEQQQIADYLDKKCADIDSLIYIKQQKIEELKEYKKSLIYEYVTGKKEVA